MQPHYHINVFWSDEDSCWIADVPDLRYCSAHGPTPVKAVRQAEEAIALWLEVARDEGIPIPEPRYRASPAGDREAA
jgi:predicted RNase H-like HicB family nuclease